VPNEVDEIVEETPADDTESSEPLEVKITNQISKDKQWNDSKDENEYDEMKITDEEIKEHGNT